MVCVPLQSCGLWRNKSERLWGGRSSGEWNIHSLHVAMRSASAGEGSHEQSIRSNRPEAETILIERKNVSSRGLTEMFRPVEG